MDTDTIDTIRTALKAEKVALEAIGAAKDTLHEAMSGSLERLRRIIIERLTSITLYVDPGDSSEFAVLGWSIDGIEKDTEEGSVYPEKWDKKDEEGWEKTAFDEMLGDGRWWDYWERIEDAETISELIDATEDLLYKLKSGETAVYAEHGAKTVLDRLAAYINEIKA